MAGGNFAGNMIASLSSLPDFLRGPILRKRMTEFFDLPEDERREVICNALEAGPSVPFPSFARLFGTWLGILASLPEGQRRGLFGAYIAEAARSPAVLAAFHLDGILEIFDGLGAAEREALAGTVRGLVGELDAESRRRLLLVIPAGAVERLGL